jgi:hypothetical protein
VVQCKHLAWLKTKALGVSAHHYFAYQLAFTELERLYLLERVDKHGTLAPLTVREALGVVAVRADVATVCPIDYLADAYAASWLKSRTKTCRFEFTAITPNSERAAHSSTDARRASRVECNRKQLRQAPLRQLQVCTGSGKPLPHFCQRAVCRYQRAAFRD